MRHLLTGRDTRRRWTALWPVLWPVLPGVVSVPAAGFLYRAVLAPIMPPALHSTLSYTAQYLGPLIAALILSLMARHGASIGRASLVSSWITALVFALVPVVIHVMELGLAAANRAQFLDETILTAFNQVLLVQTSLSFFIATINWGSLASPLPSDRKAKRSPGGELGNARFLELKTARRLFRSGGVILGEAYRPDLDPWLHGRRLGRRELQGRAFAADDPASWGRGGKTELLRYDARNASGHGLVFAGSGGFKTTGFAVPTALEWDGSLICFDPSVEIGPLVAEDRKRRGQRVISLHPKWAKNNSFNALEWVLSDMENAEEHVGVISRWIIGPTSSLGGTAKYFAETADSLIRAILADIIFDTQLDADEKTLGELRRTLAQSNNALRKTLEATAKSSESPMAARLAATLYDLAPEQFSGIAGQAQTATQFLDIQKFGALVSGSSFSVSDIARGDTDIFINVPLESLLATPAIGKIIMAALLNGMMKADGVYEKRVLVLVDEAYQLGKSFDPITKVRDVGRKYGLSLALLYQSVGQLVENYGEEGRQAFFESAAYRIYAAIQDQDMAKKLSDECGDYTGVMTNRSRSSGEWSLFGGSVSFTRTLTKVPLISPSEVRDMRSDEALVFVAGHKPIRCARPLYFRRKDMVARVSKRRF